MKMKLFTRQERPELTTEQLMERLQLMIARVDASYAHLKDRDSWAYEEYEEAASKLIDFWFEYRDQIKFCVWDSSQPNPIDVIRAWPTDVKEK